MFCVTFYFVLSGFVLCAAHESKILAGGYRFRTFIWNRFARIYPMHLLCMGLAMIAPYILPVHSNLSPGLIATHLLLLQSWVPSTDVYANINGVAWFLSSITFCYFLLYPLLHLCHKKPGCFFGLLALLIGIYLCGLPFLPQQWADWFICICPATRALDFMMGIAMYQILRHATTHRPATKETYLTDLIMLCILAVCFVAREYLPHRYALYCWSWPGACAIILNFAMGNNTSHLPNRLLSYSTLAKWGGRISFSFYMLHGILISAALAIFIHYIHNVRVIIQAGSTCLVTLVLAYLCWKYYESKFAKLLKNKF